MFMILIGKKTNSSTNYSLKTNPTEIIRCRMAESKLITVPHRDLRFTTEQLIMFLRGRKSQPEFLPPPAPDEGSSGGAQKCGIGGKTSSYKSIYLNLPRYLKICFDYCRFVTDVLGERKTYLAQLLVAEGLIVQNELGIVEEDIALSMIEELTSVGMLIQGHAYFNYEKVCSSYRHVRDEEDFGIGSPIRLFISNYDNDDTFPNLDTLPIASLFLSAFYKKNGENSIYGAHIRSVCKLKSLVVLKFDGKIEYLPDEIGDLFHLKFLGLFNSLLKELPTTIGRLQNLQTLYLKALGLRELPPQVFDIQSLRHLIMSTVFIMNGETKVHRKIGMMENLRTLEGVYAGGGIAKELSKLTQLRRLEIRRISDDHANELSASIMKMTNLIHLSMEAETILFKENGLGQWVRFFPDMETFSPPPLLQELTLKGQLVEMPNWIESMQNLTKLYLNGSRLSDNPTSEIQFLPNLKHLFLIAAAFKTKRITEEFCDPGGFPNLITLQIQSKYLVEWTEIVNGAFPSLELLDFSDCDNFRFFPDGLENILTLRELRVAPIHEDLKRRLKGEENHKIKNIPNVGLRSW